MGRAPCCDKTNVKRGPWSPDEDSILKNYLHNNGTGGNWISLPQRAGLKRCGKSCRLRWLNYLRPDIKHGAFTEEEDNTIISMYYKMGSRWSVIANNLQGRTDNDVKNHWNTKLKKKLFSESFNHTNKNNHLFNPTLNPKINNNNVIFTNNNIINPIFQVPSSSSNNDNNNISYNNNISLNQVHNHQIYVPTQSFSDLLTNCTTSSPTFATIVTNIDRDPFNIPIPNSYPFYQNLLISQASSPMTNVDNNSVDQASNASGSSSIVYGSGFEDDPFLAELGFGLMQEDQVMMNQEEDIKPQGLGQGVANY